MNFSKLAVIHICLLGGCVSETSNNSMNGDAGMNVSIQKEIAENDRERLRSNIDQLVRVGRTDCADRYALELYAPSQVSYASALRDTSKSSANALFWVLRVPENPPFSSYQMTIPNALDKPEWFAERRTDTGWVSVSKPPSMGTAHSSLIDAPVTFEQSEVQGDNVLPVALGGPLSKVLAQPEIGSYRIHFAPFTAVVGGAECVFSPSFWDVNLI